MHKRLYLILFLVLIFLTVGQHVNAQDTLQGNTRKRPTVGLVMSGGGAKGWAYIGLLRVMHEVGLEVDYVAGSSAGSIVGAMYALGYHPDTMISIIRKIDWDAIMTDKIDRKYIAYEEKEFGDSYILDLKIKKKEFGLKASMYEGQVINLMLDRVYSPAYKVHDFSKLQTPFLCIGTDLLNGEQVLLDKGYLPMAVRASMSIPAYFSPTYYDGKYLIDGGVINNYPVMPVKNKGIDYIIGADVQQGKNVTIEELNSIPKILDHIIGYYRRDANKIGYANTDMYIHFSMPYGMMDFDKYDSIIAIGEKVGRQHYDELKNLADSLNAIEYKPVKKYKGKPLDSVYIDNVVVEGNERVSSQYFEHSFNKFKNSWVSLDELEEEINMAYGSRFFSHLFYELRYNEGKTDLVLKAEEASPGYLSVGAHYDDNYSVSLLLKGKFRNVVGKNSKIFADLAIGPNARFRALYMRDNGTKPGYGAKIEIYTLSFNTYEDPANISKKTGNYRFTNFKGSLFAQTILQNKFWFRIGGNYEYFRFKSTYEDGTNDSVSDYNSYVNFYFSFNSDTRNKPYLSTRGMKSELRAEYVMPVSSDWIQNIFNNSFVVWFNYNQNIHLSKRFTLKPGAYLGATFQKGYPLNPNDIAGELKLAPVQHWFYMGGQNENNYIHGFQPFTGVRFVQKYGMYQTILRIKLQYNFYQKLYVTLMGDLGVNEWFMTDLFKSKNLIVGYGLKFSYDSFAGPVELSIMGSNIYDGVSFFINLGYSF